MKVLIAIDSMKGSLSTFAAGRAAEEGVRLAYPDAETLVSPLADGGEGTVSAIVAGAGGVTEHITVTGPLGQPVVAEYGILPETKTAVIEMAAAAGITLVSDRERNPLKTTTYGVGELILDAATRHGCRRFIIGIGGSATNDGGAGMLSALGVSFLAADGTPIARGAEGLASLASIDPSGLHPALAECDFNIACDVTNPLCGDTGCSAVYGPQKGATPDMILEMDASLERYADLTAKATGVSAKDASGAGAAGGLGFAFLSYLHGALVSGITLVMDVTGLEEKIKSADLVITGEGRLDGQSCMGKAPVGVARLAKKYGKPVIAFAGCVTPDAPLVNEHGIDAFFPIIPAPMTLAEAMDEKNAYTNMKNTVCQTLRLVKAVK